MMSKNMAKKKMSKEKQKCNDVCDHIDGLMMKSVSNEMVAKKDKQLKYKRKKKIMNTRHRICSRVEAS